MSNRSFLTCWCPQGFLESCWCWCARPSPCQTWWCCFTDSTSRSAVSSHNCSSSSPRTTLMAESQLMRTSLSVQIQYPDAHAAEAHERVWIYSASHSRFDFSSLFQRCFLLFLACGSFQNAATSLVNELEEYITESFVSSTLAQGWPYFHFFHLLW